MNWGMGERSDRVRHTDPYPSLQIWLWMEFDLTVSVWVESHSYEKTGAAACEHELSPVRWSWYQQTCLPIKQQKQAERHLPRYAEIYIMSVRRQCQCLFKQDFSSWGKSVWRMHVYIHQRYPKLGVAIPLAMSIKPALSTDIVCIQKSLRSKRISKLSIHDNRHSGIWIFFIFFASKERKLILQTSKKIQY